MAIELVTRYSALVDAKLRDEIVLKDGVIFNNRYEGTPKAGAVTIRKGGAATVQEYDRLNGVQLTENESEPIVISKFKDMVINTIIDEYNAAASADGLIADALDEGGYAMAMTLDTDGAIELATAGTVFGDTTAITADTAYDIAVDANKALTKAGVPKNGRYMIVTPDVYANMLKSPEFTKASQLGDAVVQSGAVGKMASLTIFECNYLPEGVEFIAGHPNYATRVNEWAIDVRVQSLNGDGRHIGASAVQGRKVYAHKVTSPEAILVKKSA
ncbi:MAG: hypothetical protein IJ375_03280 [Oscillospiraceae bacterium]|nr:hypothetical protein [Oscillospiraceae bacterium]